MSVCPHFFVVSRMPRCVVPVFIHAKLRRKPVETQDFASHVKVCAIYSCYNRHVVIAFVACETQDFASPEVVCAIYSCYNRHVVIAFVACETQDFASPEVVCAIYSCYNQRVVISFIACETQDFASLLNMSRFLVLCFWGITLYAALFVYASFAPPQYEKSYGAYVARYRRMEHSVTYVPY